MPIYANVAQVCRIALSEPVLDIQKQHLCLNWDPSSPRCFAVASNLIPYPTSHGWMISHYQWHQDAENMQTSKNASLESSQSGNNQKHVCPFHTPQNVTDKIRNDEQDGLLEATCNILENRENSQSLHRSGTCIFAFISYLGIVHLQVMYYCMP